MRLGNFSVSFNKQVRLCIIENLFRNIWWISILYLCNPPFSNQRLQLFIRRLNAEFNYKPALKKSFCKWKQGYSYHKLCKAFTTQYTINSNKIRPIDMDWKLYEAEMG